MSIAFLSHSLNIWTKPYLKSNEIGCCIDQTDKEWQVIENILYNKGHKRKHFSYCIIMIFLDKFPQLSDKNYSSVF